MKHSTDLKYGAVFLDLDGPILASKSRYYACYSYVCREYGLEPLEQEAYWNLKKQRVGAAAIFSRTGAGSKAEDLLQAWIASVEEPRYLALDSVHPGVLDVLSSWRKGGLRLFLATLRRRPQTLDAELEALRIRWFFERIIVCDPGRGAEGKAAEAMRNATGTDPKACVWIGDTEVDAGAAAVFGCKQLYLVTCGIRTEEYLRSLKTGEVVPDLQAIRDRLLTCTGEFAPRAR